MSFKAQSVRVSTLVQATSQAKNVTENMFERKEGVSGKVQPLESNESRAGMERRIAEYVSTAEKKRVDTFNAAIPAKANIPCTNGKKRGNVKNYAKKEAKRATAIAEQAKIAKEKADLDILLQAHTTALISASSVVLSNLINITLA
jgi:hypothetical protein